MKCSRELDDELRHLWFVYQSVHGRAAIDAVLEPLRPESKRLRPESKRLRSKRVRQPAVPPLEVAEKRFEAIVAYITCYGDRRVQIDWSERGVGSADANIPFAVALENFPWMADCTACPSIEHWHDVGGGYSFWYAAAIPCVLALGLSRGRVPVDWNLDGFGLVLSTHLAMAFKDLLLARVIALWGTELSLGGGRTHAQLVRDTCGELKSVAFTREDAPAEVARAVEGVSRREPPAELVWSLAAAFTHDVSVRAAAPRVLCFVGHVGQCHPSCNFYGAVRPCVARQDEAAQPVAFQRALEARTLHEWSQGFPEGTKFAFVAVLTYPVDPRGGFVNGRQHTRTEGGLASHAVLLCRGIGNAVGDDNGSCGSLVQAKIDGRCNVDSAEARSTLAAACREVLRREAAAAEGE